jgi:hypothetical protein
MIEWAARHDAAQAVLFLNYCASRAALETKELRRAKNFRLTFAVRLWEAERRISGLCWLDLIAQDSA